MTFQVIWNDIDQELKDVKSEIFYNSWITYITPVTYADGKFVLEVPNQFVKGQIDVLYTKDIERLLRERLGEKTQLIITYKDDIDYDKWANLVSDKIDKNTVTKSNEAIEYTFKNFVRGKSNELAYAGAMAVAEKPGFSYNPLFIYGGVGLGKTHLMKGCASQIRKNFPEMKVVYTTSEKFTNELIRSIRDKQNEEFRDKYRNIDVLLVDDIQFIAGKEATQEEFFHTFNDLYHSNKQIVLSSDKPPHEIKTLEDRLRSRFEMGLITDISSPDYETRVAILQEKARYYERKFPEDVLIFIAENVESNIRELEGALNTVYVFSKFKNKEINVELAQSALERTLGVRKKEPLTVEKIIEIIASENQITPADIYSSNRKRNIARPRQIAMYFSRKLTDLSLVQIAARFEKDHSTIIYGINKIEKDMESDELFKQEIERIGGLFD